MSAHDLTWATLLLLGALHGLNPAMGWLFAVALGLQEGRGQAVWRALPPLALGHAIAIGVVVALAAAVGLVLPLSVLKWVVAAMLLSLGAYRLVRHRHRRYGGMRVGARELTVWSFLMAWAHGAGLMVLPFVLDSGGTMVHAGGHAASSGHAAHAAMLAGSAGVVGGVGGLAATLVHTAGFLLVAGTLALVVYRYVGLRRLRSLWVNLDLVWAVVLIITAVLTPLL